MYEHISSPQNPKIKNLVRLKEKASERRKAGLTVVEGRIEMALALKSAMPLLQLYFCPDIITAQEVESLLISAPKRPEAIYSVSKNVFEKIAYRENSAGLVALLRPTTYNLATLPLSQNPLLIVLESVEKPGNLGAILRTADAARADAVIVCDPQTDVYNPNAIRASIGCVFTKPVVACSSEECIAFLRKKGIQILATALSASVPYTQLDYRRPSAIVMGTEASGLSEQWLQASDQNIIIPMRGEIDSMNVSVAAAIVIFEALRQREADA
jgi:TrmH family RNA methyltransferase